ncbi:MAG: 1-acyl-sn-glycerol-3-phosphate acyltransferase [Firmicutes bacterium]|nr:1-acyl-sn-glycerol-3-phosphate acyltransferase [Bacillota bacterium]
MKIFLLKVFRTIVALIIFIPFRLLFPVKVIGKGNLPKRQNYLTMSNHLHWFDILSLWVYLPRFKFFLAKKELGAKRFNRFILKLMGAVFIDRHKPDIKGIKNAVAALKKAPMTLFPEGTRNKDDNSLQAVKGGAAMIAAKADVPLVSLIIDHKQRIFRKNYFYITPYIYLPYTSKDRFDSNALRECTEIITEEMTYAREFMDIIQGFNKKEFKQLKKEEKAARKIK